MRTTRIRCALVLIDDDDRSVQLLARLSRDDSYSVAMTVGRASSAKRRNVRMLARLLRSSGQVVDVSVGEWASIERLGRPPRPDVLLVDVDERTDAAVSLIRHARSMIPDLTVVAITDRADELSSALGSHPVTVFEKPLDYGALREALLSSRPRSTSEIVPLGDEEARPMRRQGQ